jgi:mediator of RNA polymerase II transcription subunit 12
MDITIHILVHSFTLSSSSATVLLIGSFSLKLLRTFYSEGLVDNRTFLLWLVQQLGCCNLAQAGFVTRLADKYLDGMLGSRPLTRPFVDACLVRLSEVR